MINISMHFVFNDTIMILAWHLFLRSFNYLDNKVELPIFDDRIQCISSAALWSRAASKAERYRDGNMMFFNMAECIYLQRQGAIVWQGIISDRKTLNTLLFISICEYVFICKWKCNTSRCNKINLAHVPSIPKKIGA